MQKRDPHAATSDSRLRQSSRHGTLLALEGPCSDMKTNVAGALAAQLTADGHRTIFASSPAREFCLSEHMSHDSGPGVDSPRKVHVSATSSYLAYVAAQVNFIEGIVEPALRNGTHVIIDGYWWSTLAMGSAARINSSVVRSSVEIELSVWGEGKPSCVILFKRGLTNACDLGTRATALAKAYLEIANTASGEYSIVTLDTCDRTVDGLVSEVLFTAKKYFDLSRRDDRRTLKKHDEQLNMAGMPNLSEHHNTNGQIKPVTPDVWIRLAPAKPTEVYAAYWKFARDRQEIFFKRFWRESYPWSSDPVLLKYKFTNAYRASDRASQYLIRNVIYKGDQSPNEVFFRTILFKLFNKIETWEFLERTLGRISWHEYSYNRYGAALDSAFSKGTLYSAAYIMPSCKSAYGHERKHSNHLQLLETMVRENVPSRIQEAKSMAGVFSLLLKYHGIGAFLAFQYCIDINYSSLTDFSEMQFVVPGPGAFDGIRKCFSDPGGLTEVEIIKYMADNQEREFACYDLKFRTLWGRRLQLIDCQNLFCEISKYAREAFPQVDGLSGRTRIKQHFKPQPTPIKLWYPPKWGINDRIQEGVVPE
jgi:thymidylate kinase